MSAEVADRIARLEDRAMTQEALAEATNVEPRYIQDVERGRTNLSLFVLVDLATALRVDERVLFRRAELLPPRTGRPPKRR